jgi:hypothetical protein
MEPIGAMRREVVDANPIERYGRPMRDSNRRLLACQASGTAFVRVNTAKTEFLQAKLQVKNSRRMPWVSIMIVANHLRPAAIKAGVHLIQARLSNLHCAAYARSAAARHTSRTVPLT